MKNLFARLLPIHAARERRALRVYHEQNLMYEAAFAKQMDTTLQHVRLKAAAQKQLASVLDVQALSAAEAQYMLQTRTELQDAASAVSDRIPELSQRTQASLESSRDARRAYEKKLQTHFKMGEANRRAFSQQRRSIESLAEQRAEDEFAAHQSVRAADSGQS